MKIINKLLAAFKDLDVNLTAANIDEIATKLKDNVYVSIDAVFAANKKLSATYRNYAGRF